MAYEREGGSEQGVVGQVGGVALYAINKMHTSQTRAAAAACGKNVNEPSGQTGRESGREIMQQEAHNLGYHGMHSNEDLFGISSSIDYVAPVAASVYLWLYYRQRCHET